jgi:hypothetical protein
MARPNKQGIDYFPFDVDFFNDEKIGAISGEFGIKGELACIKLLCAIYRQGYFVLWSEMLKMKLIKELSGVSADLLDQIVSRLVRWGFFDKYLFEKSGILTSSGIQRRYFEITKRRIIGSDDLPYLLVNANRNPVNVDRNPLSTVVNVDINSQSKEKNIKRISNDIQESIPFETVWEMYGHKGNKKTSQRKWANLKNHCREAALNHIPLYVKATPDKQYRKNFETYLHQEAWNDEILPPKQQVNETNQVQNIYVVPD